MRATSCLMLGSGKVELYFYDELPAAERETVARHLAGCRACREALDDLAAIRSALAAQPVVSEPASGDWSAFMARLDRSVIVAQPPEPVREPGAARRHVPLLAVAALLALVTMSVLAALRSGAFQPEHSIEMVLGEAPGGSEPVGEAARLVAVGQQHLERSRLVLLGLAGRDADATLPGDWHYERELASRLLDDTRLYRLAAEQRGLSAMAGVMRDLEFVLLQASMTEGRDRADLSQIQRAIRKRDLLQKVDVVRTAGL